MTDKTQIMRSLELVAERFGDPINPVYEALFAANPEIEALFAIDDDWAVRGSMLYHTFECIQDYCADGRIVRGFVLSSRIVHRDYGVPEEVFDTFFVTLRDTFRTLLGADWTAGMEAEWATMLAAFSEMR